MAQASEFPLRKPPGFHYDFFLLGITTFIAGLIGLPAPNGLIPQAPIHTKSLLVTGQSQQIASRPQVHSRSSRESNGNSTTENSIHRDFNPPFLPASFIHEVPIAVVEQRVSNLAQGSLCLVLLTGPFLHVLNLIPRGVLAGLLWVFFFFSNFILFFCEVFNYVFFLLAGIWASMPSNQTE